VTSTDPHQEAPIGGGPRRGTTTAMVLAGVAAAAAGIAIGVLVAGLPHNSRSTDGEASTSALSAAHSLAPSGAPVVVVGASTKAAPTTRSTPATPTTHTTSPAATTSGPRIVSFKLTQQPRCPEGTAVFRAPAVPARIAWKVTGAGGVALSVDNPDLVGAYGNYETEGSLEFMFSCGGPVGSTETHTYTINTFGGPGPHQRAQLTASAKVLDGGIGSA
jgi:hypothetical protein